MNTRISMNTHATSMLQSLLIKVDIEGAIEYNVLYLGL